MFKDSEMSYYGRLGGPKPTVSIADYLLQENYRRMNELFTEMEERLKRHVTECKRDIIKEIEKITKPVNKEIQSTKGEKDGKVVKRKSRNNVGYYEEN